jgi:acetyl esterase/lipase
VTTLALVGLSGLTSPASAAAATIKLRSGVQYGSDGGVPLYVDVYSPAKATSTRMRAAVFVHGGGWAGGSRSEWSSHAAALAAEGWVAFSIDYRLNSPTPYVSEPQDVSAAVAWVQRNARTYGVDPARVALVGSSAGGQLAALQAMSGAGAPGMTGRVKALVTWSAPTDMALLTEEYGCLDQPCSYSTQWAAAMAQWFEGGCLPSECADRWANTSPVSHVDATDPATFLVNSAEETTVPVEQLRVMQDRLTAEGVPVGTLVVDGTKHAQGYSTVAWPATLAFLRATV